MKNDMHVIMRDEFELVTAQNFCGDDVKYNDRGEKFFPRNSKGEYTNPVLEDHWQTFQEGWECAIEYLKMRKNTQYTDIVSDGGIDRRL